MVEKKKIKKNLSKKALEQKKVIKAAKITKKTTAKAKVAKVKAKPKAVTHKKKAIPKKDYTTMIALGVVIITIITIAFFTLNSPETVPGNETVEIMVLATINGEEITDAEIDLILSRIPPQNRAQFTRESLVDQLINEKLLLQEANSKELTADETEIEEFLQLILATNQITLEQLEAKLLEQGLTVDELNKEIQKQIILTKLVNQEVEIENITDEELEAYYDVNIQSFVKSSESVNASHILICHDESLSGCLENRTQEEALILAEEILAKITDDNFAEIASEYSDGPSAPRGGNLGYFTKGQMVAEFENAAFNLEIGTVSELVLTQFGYHILKVFDKTEEEVSSFEEVKITIQTQLEAQQRQLKFQEYVDSLKEEAEIVEYS